jgi:hypothetical protein
MARVPYGPPIQDAIARGDIAAMKALVGEAERHLREHGDVRHALEVLKLEIARREGAAAGSTGGTTRPPYGTAIHAAIARGDVGEMKELLQRAEAYLADAGDLRMAVELLKVEVAKLEKGTPGKP